MRINYESQILSPQPDVMSNELAELYQMWMDARDGDIAPSWSVFSGIAIRMPALPKSVVVDVKNTPRDFVYRFWGTGRTRSQGNDLTGQSVSAIKPPETAKKITNEYNEVLNRGEPIWIPTKATYFGIDRVYDWLRLPLSTDGQNIDMVFSTGIGDDSIEQHYFEKLSEA